MNDLTPLQQAILGWLSIVTIVCGFLGAIWKYGIRPMMIAIGKLLETMEEVAKHTQRLDTIEKRLNQIERNTHAGPS